MTAAAQTSEDRRPVVTFEFEGRHLQARHGQSIAAAVIDSGTGILSRSFKYRRPRGYTCGYDICGNCPMTLNGLPGVTSCTTAVANGDVVRRERGWPNAGLDVMQLGDLFARFIPAGFQFRLFRRHPRLAHLAEKVMARVAGAGRFPTTAAAAATRTSARAARPDVLVVGGGLSGCAAALGAASAGATVVLAHRGPLGGRSRAGVGDTTWRSNDVPLAELADRLAAQVSADPAITVIDGTAVSWYDDGCVPIVGAGELVETRPGRLVVATGSYDVPALFAGNDKPGVVLADGVSKMLHVEKLSPWRRALVLTDGPRGHALAAQLRAAGVEVLAVVDQEEADTGGTPAPGCVPGRVIRARGHRRVRAVDVAVGDEVRTYVVDLLCVALRERPADDLVLQWLYAEARTTVDAAGWAATASADALTVVGSAAGWTAPDPERAYDAAAAAATPTTRKTL